MRRLGMCAAVLAGLAACGGGTEQFGVTHAFRYRLASGEVKTASVTTACG